MRETYYSVDIEADGPIPGPHSMLSVGVVAFDVDGVELGSFSRNLFLLPGATPNEETMRWWAGFPEAWAACRTDCVAPDAAMHDLVAWVGGLPGKPVWVGYPVAFDFMFVHWYLHRFVGKSPFSHSALDMKTMAHLLLGGHFREASKRRMPRSWFPPENLHRHVALDDAREQGLLFFAMRRAWLAQQVATDTP